MASVPSASAFPSSSPQASLGSSSALYLYTFIATLALLVGVSGAVVWRAFRLRRRHRAALARAIAEGTFHPGMLNPRLDRRDARIARALGLGRAAALGARPEMFEVCVRDPDADAPLGAWPVDSRAADCEKGWMDVLPVSAAHPSALSPSSLSSPSSQSDAPLSPAAALREATHGRDAADADGPSPFMSALPLNFLFRRDAPAYPPSAYPSPFSASPFRSSQPSTVPPPTHAHAHTHAHTPALVSAPAPTPAPASAPVSAPRTHTAAHAHASRDAEPSAQTESWTWPWTVSSPSSGQQSSPDSTDDDKALAVTVLIALPAPPISPGEPALKPGAPRELRDVAFGVARARVARAGGRGAGSAGEKD